MYKYRSTEQAQYLIDNEENDFDITDTAALQNVT
jgi:hypothetical protein